jgi:hypothetical protein
MKSDRMNSDEKSTNKHNSKQAYTEVAERRHDMSWSAKKAMKASTDNVLGPTRNTRCQTKSKLSQAVR